MRPGAINRACNAEQNRDQWLDLRRTHLGASEIGALLGVNPYVEPAEVIDRKRTGRQIPDNRAMAIGRALEPKLLDAYRAIYKPVYGAGSCWTCDGIIVTFDGVTDDGPIEIKTAAMRQRDRWVAHGPPPWYRLQVQAQCWMADVNEGELLVAFHEGGNVKSIHHFEGKADHAAIERAVEMWKEVQL